MDLRAVRALLAIHFRGAWNRTLKESGLAGPLLTLASLGFVALILTVPFFLCFRLGISLGAALRESDPVEALLHWCALQALFTVGFAVLGVFRQRPAFPWQALGALPIPRLALLLAELPAALFEVFPLLAACAIVGSNLGLLYAWPAAFPIIAVLALQGMAAMLALLVLLAGVRRLWGEWRCWALAAALAALAVALGLDRLELKAALSEFGPRFIAWLPGSQGYAGLVHLGSGRVPAGLVGLTMALLATGALVAAAAWTHERALARESSGARWRPGLLVPFHFRRPAAGIAWIYARQLLDCKAGQMILAISPLVSASFAVVLWAMRIDAERDAALAEFAGPAITHLTRLPLLALTFFLLVPLASGLWMNVFGWDRAGIRTLLLLPLPARAILRGKLLGLALFVALQAVLGALPLLAVYRPSRYELIGAVAAAATALVVAGGAGQIFSLRFPRAVSRDGSPNLPLYLSWVPSVIVLALALLLWRVHELVAGLARWATPAAFALTLALAIATYAAVLPFLAAELERERERLLDM